MAAEGLVAEAPAAAGPPGDETWSLAPHDDPAPTAWQARRDRFAALRQLLVRADALAGAVAGVTAALVAGGDVSHAAILALVLAVAWPTCAFLCRLYAVTDLASWSSGVGELPKLAVGCLLLSWPIYGLASVVGGMAPVVAALAAPALCGVGAGTARAIARLSAHRSHGLHERVLIVGSGVVADQLVERLRIHDELGLEPVGFIDDDVHAVGDDLAAALPRLGRLEDLPGLLRLTGADRVMVAFSRAGHEPLLHCLRTCRDAGVAVDVVPRLFEFLDGARTLDGIGGMPLLSIHAPSFSPVATAVKRALDLAGAALGLIVMAPLLLAIAVAIKLDSPGPVLFRQRRAGRGGRWFVLYKFRSMRVGSTVQVRHDGAIVKHPDDKRITRVGRLLRRFSLDEAPQLINVLRGDMSLVGPRPLVEQEAQALHESWHARRADLRPGLTGPWQIAGRSHIPFHEMIRFDYQYVAGWSLARDVEILLATIPTVLSGRGAY